MAKVQVPTVTIDDLRIFQANHFLGHYHDYTYIENSQDELAVDDDLGYYPDGVKRTLTDEQIEIFRHSEIHSLLREKRLREEALAESHEEEKLKNHGGNDVIVHGKQGRSGVATGEAEDAKEELNGSRQSGHMSSKTKHEKSNGSNSEALNYAEDDPNQGDVQMNASPASDPRFFRRKIVTYAD